MSESPESREGPAAGDGPPLSVVIVGYDSAAALGRALPPLLAQLRVGDELIVCDNASRDGTTAAVRDLAPDATLIEPGVNLGFGAGCNLAATRARNDLLLFLNPDNVVGPGFRGAIELPLIEDRGWSAWQGLVTDAGGELINTLGGVVHFTGIAWAGAAGRPLSHAPTAPAGIPFASGACLAIRRDVWREVGGFSEPFFLYHEDTDLGLRLWLGGHRVGIEPRALCDHEYEFAKGQHKWRLLERNRWATLIRTYPLRLLVILTPALLATELALLVVAARGGWLKEKLHANAEAIRWFPRLLRERRAIQSRARINARTFANHCLTPDLDSEYLGQPAKSALLRSLLRTYWRLARALL